VSDAAIAAPAVTHVGLYGMTAYRFRHRPEPPNSSSASATPSHRDIRADAVVFADILNKLSDA
jgi:hypothetical protein